MESAPGRECVDLRGGGGGGGGGWGGGGRVMRICGGRCVDRRAQ